MIINYSNRHKYIFLGKVTMFSNDILDKIKQDETVGAGNFLYKLREIVGDVSNKKLFLDRPYIDHHGDSWSALSVDDILTLADELSN